MKQRLRLPFVITVVGTAAACNGTAVIDGSNDTTSAGGSGQGGNGQGAGGSSAGGEGGTSHTCPAEAPQPFVRCALPPDATCRYDVACQSGQVELEFYCLNGFWDIVPSACRQPYDSCAGTHYYCDGEWWMPQGTNPPSPCPDTAPLEGESCFLGDLGGVWEHCGYHCPNTGLWAIATCTPDMPPDGHWQYNGTCN